MEMKSCRRVSTTATVEHACPEQVGKSHMLPTLRLFGDRLFVLLSMISATCSVDQLALETATGCAVDQSFATPLSRVNTAQSCVIPLSRVQHRPVACNTVSRV